MNATSAVFQVHACAYGVNLTTEGGEENWAPLLTGGESRNIVRHGFFFMPLEMLSQPQQMVVHQVENSPQPTSSETLNCFAVDVRTSQAQKGDILPAR